MSKKKNSQEFFEFPFDLEKVFSPNYFNVLPKWQQEIASFYKRRLESYSTIHKQLGECRNPQDIFELQSEFFAKLQSDYRNEAAVISELLFDVSKDVVEQTQKSTEETILKAEKDAEKIVELAKDQAEAIIEAAKARADTQANGKKKSSKVA